MRPDRFSGCYRGTHTVYDGKNVEHARDKECVRLHQRDRLRERPNVSDRENEDPLILPGRDNADQAFFADVCLV